MVFVLEVTNDELMESLARQAKELGIANAAIVSLIGGVDSFTVSTMPADNASKDIVSTYSLPAEMHGSGEIKDGAVHVHATMAVRKYSVIPWGGWFGLVVGVV
jgi:uncharacterized protein